MASRSFLIVVTRSGSLCNNCRSPLSVGDMSHFWTRTQTRGTRMYCKNCFNIDPDKPKENTISTVTQATLETSSVSPAIADTHVIVDRLLKGINELKTDTRKNYEALLEMSRVILDLEKRLR